MKSKLEIIACVLIVAVLWFSIGVIIGKTITSTNNLVCVQPHLLNGNAVCAIYANKEVMSK